jgi:hypothetical protein
MNAKFMVGLGMFCFFCNLVCVGIYWHRGERTLTLLYIFVAAMWAIYTAFCARALERQKKLDKDE